jgi:hypothetical protein
MIDRHERELHPRQIHVRHRLAPVPTTSPRDDLAAPRTPFPSRHGPILDFADTRMFSTLAETRPCGIPPAEG